MRPLRALCAAARGCAREACGDGGEGEEGFGRVGYPSRLYGPFGFGGDEPSPSRSCCFELTPEKRASPEYRAIQRFKPLGPELTKYKGLWCALSPVVFVTPGGACVDLQTARVEKCGFMLAHAQVQHRILQVFANVEVLMGRTRR